MNQTIPVWKNGAQDYYYANREKILAYQRKRWPKYARENREKLLRKSREIYKRNGDELRRKARERHAYKRATDPAYREREKQASKRYRDNNREKTNRLCRERNQRVKLNVLQKISKSENVSCKKCGFRDIRTLQIDHIHGGGLKEINSFRSRDRYLKHVVDNIDKYQVLCANCNWIKRFENDESGNKNK